MNRIALVAGLVVGACSLASANLITNGSFEDGNLPNYNFVQLDAGSTSLAGWEIVSGNIDYIAHFWQASDGGRSIDLSGNTAGMIRQTVNTQIGVVYELSFDYSGDPTAQMERQFKIIAGAAEDIMSVSPFGTRSAMNWSTGSMLFTATSEQTVIAFQSLEDGYYGAALDNVRLSVVPTPASAALLGLSGLCTIKRRRK